MKDRRINKTTVSLAKYLIRCELVDEGWGDGRVLGGHTGPERLATWLHNWTKRWTIRRKPNKRKVTR